jgi:hypothetical protein
MLLRSCPVGVEGADVGGAIVAHHRLELDAAGVGKPEGSAAKKASGMLTAETVQDLGIGEPRVIVDRNVQVLPAGGARAATL